MLERTTANYKAQVGGAFVQRGRRQSILVCRESFPEVAGGIGALDAQGMRVCDLVKHETENIPMVSRSISYTPGIFSQSRVLLV